MSINHLEQKSEEIWIGASLSASYCKLKVVVENSSNCLVFCIKILYNEFITILTLARLHKFILSSLLQCSHRLYYRSQQ